MASFINNCSFEEPYGRYIHSRLVTSAERQPLKAFTERAYLDYSMYVILTARCPTSVMASSRCSAASFIR